jgi:hypothetical protein
VNVTLGLPFIRTSPDHGTAFDIAGTGRADPDEPDRRAGDGRRDGPSPRRPGMSAPPPFILAKNSRRRRRRR